MALASWLYFRRDAAGAGTERILEFGETAKRCKAREIEIQLRVGHRATRVDELCLIDFAQIALARCDAERARGRLDSLCRGAERGLRVFEILKSLLHLETNLLLLERPVVACLALHGSCARNTGLIAAAGEEIEPQDHRSQ